MFSDDPRRNEPQVVLQDVDAVNVAQNGSRTMRPHRCTVQNSVPTTGENAFRSIRFTFAFSITLKPLFAHLLN